MGDGIVYRSWKAPTPSAILLLVHGLGANSLRWKFLAEFFLRHNISSYAVELQGQTFRANLQSVTALCGVIKEENPGKEIFLAGESMGAVIAFLAAVRYAGIFAGLVCLAPAFKSRLKFTLLDYLKIFIPLAYNPHKSITMPFNSAMCTRDTDYIKVIEAENPGPVQASSRLLFDMAIGEAKCGLVKNGLRTPVLFLVPGDDKLMDPEASAAFFKKMKLKDKKLIEYPEMYHSISIDIGREKVFADMLEWIRPRLQRRTR